MNMKTNIYIAGSITAEILETVTPPPGMTVRVRPYIPSEIRDVEAVNVIIIRKMPAVMHDGARYVLCSKAPADLNAETLGKLYDLWPEPLTPSLLKFYSTQLLGRINSEHLNTSEGITYQKRIIEMARQDYLTGLATRWYLQEYIAENTAEGDVTCIYFDLDNFKAVNDTYGHQAGDRALAATAEMMQRDFAPEGFCARMGGDEFMIVLAGTYDMEEVVRRVEGFMTGLLEYYGGTKTMTGLSVSAGISQKVHGDGKTIDRLIHESDTALYAAKNAGRGCCKVYAPELERKDETPEVSTFYLVDYENVHSAGLDGIHKLDADSKVCIFYSRNASNLTSGMNMNIRESKAEITYHHAEAGTKNALDFQLSSYLGELITENSGHKCRYYIVSKDGGFSGLVPFWRERGVMVEIIPDISGHGTAEIDELSRRVEVLAGEGVMSRQIAEIIHNSGTKIEVNTAIQRLYRNNRAGEIYRSIRPLIEDKPGQHKRVRVL